jgi:uncharacterized membrane protein
VNRLDTLTPPADDLRSGTPDFLEQRYGPAGGGQEPGHRLNVGGNERTLSVLGGAALIALGLARGRLGGLAVAAAGAMAIKRGLEGHCPVYEALGVNTADGDTPDPSTLYERGVKILEVVTVQRPAQELYDYWHDFSNQPRFMHNVESVRPTGDGAGEGGRTFWRLRGPAGMIWEYEAEIINDEPGRLIAWRSVGGADVQHAGSVRFVDAPGDRGTEVHFNVEYLPPAGFVGKFGAKVLGLLGQAPRNDVREGLRNFKRLMEAGELPTTEGQPRGSKC